MPKKLEMPRLPDPTKAFQTVKGDVSASANVAGNTIADVLMAPVKTIQKITGQENVSGEGMSLPELPALPDLGELKLPFTNDEPKQAESSEGISSELRFQKKDSYGMTD